MAELLARLRGALADRYAIDRELGHGGTATVYLARDLKHGRSVAVKVLRPELAAALGAERFLREIEIAAGPAEPRTAVARRGSSEDRARGCDRLEPRPQPGCGAPGHQAGEHPVIR